MKRKKLSTCVRVQYQELTQVYHIARLYRRGSGVSMQAQLVSDFTCDHDLEQRSPNHKCAMHQEMVRWKNSATCIKIILTPESKYRLKTQCQHCQLSQDPDEE